jgi:hypothetical protein
LCDGAHAIPDIVHALSEKYSDVSDDDIYEFINMSTNRIWLDPPAQ